MNTYDIIQFNGANVSYRTGIPYLTTHLPRWDGTNAALEPKLANNKGYDVQAPQLGQARREAAYARANGNVCDGQFWWPLFITEVSIDIALAGKTAQARMTRDFYPHNFTQPRFEVTGQALDQRDYGSLTEFVHQAQQHSLLSGGALMQLYIKGGGIPGGRKSGYGVHRNLDAFPNQVMRGSHKPILCQGYISAMPRQHSSLATGPSSTARHGSDVTTPTGTDAFAGSDLGSGRGGSSLAPQYTFEFVVADMILGPYHEDLVQVVQQQNWIDVVKGTQTLTVNQALLKENNQILDFAKANAVNVLNSGQG